jgi:hypothetical protein
MSETRQPHTSRRRRTFLGPWAGLAALLLVILGVMLVQRNAASHAPLVTLVSPTLAQNAAGAPDEATLQALPTQTRAGTLASSDDVQRISPADAKAMIDQGKAVLYDVRSFEAFDTKHARGSVSLPEERIPSELGNLPKDKALILVCT